MWAVGVEVLRILAQHDVEVARSCDQDVVEAFPSQCPDEAFCDRVRPGRSDRGADDLDIGARASPDPGAVLARRDRVGAENPVTSRDLHVFVDEAAEPVSS